MNPKIHKLPVFAFLLLLLAATVSVASAANGTWTGSANATWDPSSTNWSGVSGSPWNSSNGTGNLAIFNTANATALVSGTVYVNGITFSNTATISNGTITLSGTNPILTSANATIASVVAGNSGLTKNGTATLILSGNNTYSGNTTVSAGGALQLANSNALGNSSLTADSAGDVYLSGNVAITNSVSVAGAGGGSNGVLQNLSGNNTLGNFSLSSKTGTRINVASGSTLNITNNIAVSSNATAQQGFRFLGGGTLVLSGNNSAIWASGVQNTLGNGGAGGLTIKLGSDTALGASTIIFDANSTVQSNDATDRHLNNALTFNAIASSVTLGAASTGNLTFEGAVSLAAATTLNLTIANTQTTLNGAFATSTGSLNKLGSGTLALTSTNAYTGTTTIGAGSISASNIVVSGGTSNLGNATSAVVLGGASTAGTLSYTGNNATYTRGFTIGAGGGEVDVTSNSSTLTIDTGNIDKSSGGLLTIGGAGNTTITSNITGSGGLTKTGAGTLNLSGNNSYSGNTIVNAGGLQLASSNALGSSSLTANNTGGEVYLSGNVTVANSVSASGSGASSNGVLQNLSGNNTLGNFSVASQIGTRINVASGSTLNITNNITVSSNASLTQGFRFLGGGTLVLSGNNSVIWAGVQNTLGLSGAGGLTIKLGSDTALGSSTIIFDGNATVQSNDATARNLTDGLTFNTTAPSVTLGAASTGNLSFSGAVSLPSSTVNLTVPNTQTTLSGVVSGSSSGTLTKLGSGTLVLGGTSANTFNGTTAVSAGVLNLNKTAGVNAVGGNLTINGGAVTFGANNQIISTAAVSMSGNSSVLNGTGNGTSGVLGGLQQTLGSLSIAGGGFNSGSGSTWTVTGAASVTGGGTSGTYFAGYSGSTFTANSLSLNALTGTAGSVIGTAGFYLYGNSNATVTTATVGGGGLSMNGSVLNLRKGTSAGNLGSTLRLDGDVTTSGTTASSISEDTSGSPTNGTVSLALSATTSGPVTRAFNVAGGGADLTVGVAITNGNSTAASLSKTGNGNLTFSAANTYTGATTISTGTLVLSGAGTVGSGNLTVASGAKLDISGITGSTYALGSNQTLGGSGTVTATGKTLSVAGNLNPGSNLGTLTVDGGFTLAGTSNSTFEINGTSGGSFDRLIVNGLLTFGGTLNLSTGYTANLGDSVNLFTWSTKSGTFSLINGTDLGGGKSWDTSNLYSTGVITVVPEPATWGLLAFSLTTVMVLRRRNRKV